MPKVQYKSHTLVADEARVVVTHSLLFGLLRYERTYRGLREFPGGDEFWSWTKTKDGTPVDDVMSYYLDLMTRNALREDMLRGDKQKAKVANTPTKGVEK